MKPVERTMTTTKDYPVVLYDGWSDDGKTLYMTAVTSVYRVRTLVGR